jgi:hypothetical protein
MSRLQAAIRDDETIDVALLGNGELVSLTAAGIDRWKIGGDGTLSLLETVAHRGLTHIAAAGTTVAVSGQGFVYISVVEAGALSQRGMLHVAGNVNAMAFHGGTLVLALEGIGIELLDPMDFASADILPEPAKDLAVVGDMLYVAAGGSGLLTITLDGTPRVLGRFAGGEANLTRIAASGTRVYAVESEHLVHAYDAADPAALVAIGTLDEPAQAIAAGGDSLFTGGTRLDAYGLPISNSVVLRAFDGALHKTAESAEAAGVVSGVALAPNGSIAYVVDRPYLRVFDVSKSAAPRQIAALQLDSIEDHVRINAAGTRVVLYNRGEVQLVDVANPYRPRPIGVWSSSGRPPSRADFLHDFVLEANWTTGFHVLDFDHYDPPAIIGSMKMDYHELAIKHGGDVAYISPERIAIAPIDLSNPTKPYNPRVLFMWMKEGAFADANESHADLLLARTPDGIHVLELADPLTPVEVSSVAIPESISLTASGQTAYAAVDGYVFPIDLTNAAAPVLGTSAMRATAPQQMAAAAGKLVVADTYSLRVYGPDTPPVPPERVKPRVTNRP